MKIIEIIDAVRLSDCCTKENTLKNKVVTMIKTVSYCKLDRFRETCWLVFACQGWILHVL